MHARPLWFWHGKKTGLKQVEAIFRLVLTIIGIIGEVASSYNGEKSAHYKHSEHSFKDFIFKSPCTKEKIRLVGLMIIITGVVTRLFFIRSSF